MKLTSKGSGWHFESMRHSNARKFGHAGGSYASKNLGSSYQSDDKSLSGSDIRLLKMRQIANKFVVASNKQDVNKYADEMYSLADQENEYAQETGDTKNLRTMVFITSSMRNWSARRLKEMQGVMKERLKETRDGSGSAFKATEFFDSKTIKRDVPIFKPMLAVKTNELPKNHFIAEEKIDGSRTLMYATKSDVAYINRRGVNKTSIYPELWDQYKKLNIDGLTVLDGELVAYNKKGRDDFHLLSKRDHLSSTEEARKIAKIIPLNYRAFDVLVYNGKDVRNLPLHERKRLLDKVIPGTHSGRIQQVLGSKNPESFLKQMKNKKDAEGILLKNVNSKYVGKRVSDWQKFKFLKRADVAITGYEEGKGVRKNAIGSFHLSVYKDGKLIPVGKVGTGLTLAEAHEWKQKLDKIKTGQQKNIINVKPKYIASVEYLRLGSQGRLRAPALKGIRTDVTYHNTHI